MGTRRASKSTEFQGTEPTFTVDPDRIDANAIVSQKGFARESTLTANGAVFARGRVTSPFGFTLVRDFEPIGVSAPSGEGGRPGPRDMAALLKVREGVWLEVWAPYMQSEDAFQEQMGSKNGYSNVARSGVNDTVNAEFGWAIVEQPGKNDASIAIYRLASTLSKPQAIQAWNMGLLQKEVAQKLGIDVRTEAERETAKETANQEMKDKYADQKAQIEAEIAELQQRKELDELAAKRDALKTGTTTTTPGGTMTLRTYEVYGKVNNVKMPLIQVVQNQGGVFTVVPGGQLFVGNEATDGFGLAGIPGRWPVAYPGQSPANYGQDPDKAVMAWDGSRAWVVPATTLTQLFGTNWRAQIY